MSQTVFITGTSSGLGRATAKLFQAHGWNVVATMRSPESETELMHLDRTLVTRLDVLDGASIHEAVRAAIERFGRIDTLVNNAGYGAYGPLEAIPEEKLRRQFDVNVFGLLATTKAVVPYLRANRSGTVINISSIGGKVAFPLGTPYHGSKYAVEGISESLYYELGSFGVRVKIVEPGGINTDFGGRSFDLTNDSELTDYQPLMQRVLEVLGPLMANGSAPEAIAEVIYSAATDGTDQLRYVAGADAEQTLAGRGAVDDAAFMAGMKAQFGLA